MTFFRSRVKRFVAQILVGLLVLTHLFVLLPQSQVSAAPSTTVVLNEVQMAGRGVLRPTDEFIELYNREAKDLNISGWYISKHDQNGKNEKVLWTFPSETSINTQDALLIANEDYRGDVTPDFVYAGDIASDTTVTLVDKGGIIVDQLGFGTATNREGVAVANPEPGQSVSRAAGHEDTNNNATDWQQLETPTPQASKPSAPVLKSIEGSDRTLTVSWDKVRNAQIYDVRYKKSGTEAYESAGDTNDLSKTIRNLENGTPYTVALAARNAMGSSREVTQEGTPSVVATVSAVYVQNSKVGTHFSSGPVSIVVIPEVGTPLTGEDELSLKLERPNMPALNAVLPYNKDKKVWALSFQMEKASNSNQDGKVTASIATKTPGKRVAIKAGDSFTVDTFVSKPDIKVKGAKPGQQDSLVATTDADVDRLAIYKSASLDLSNLVALASAKDGKTDEIFIGDNVFGTLYAVAKDKTGNSSDVVTVTNDIASPPVDLKLENSQRMVVASWPAIIDATEYVIRWRQGENNWQEKTANTTRHEISSVVGKEYEVSVASRDAAGNQSGFTTKKLIAKWNASDMGRGGAAGREQAILSSSHSSIGPKDANGVGGEKSPYSLQEDRDQNGILDKGEDKAGNDLRDGQEDLDKNGIKDGEEDRDKNGVKDGEEDKDNNGIKDGEEDREGGLGRFGTASPAPSDSESPAPEQAARDNSRIILTIALLLIVLGTALAVYSWFRGDGGAGGGGSETNRSPDGPPASDEVETTDEEAAADEAAVDESDKSKQRKSRPRRKTRW